MFWSFSQQVAQRDIMNSIDREMSGDLKSGFKCIGILSTELIAIYTDRSMASQIERSWKQT